MHELAIAETICKTIEREAGKRGMTALSSARLRLGNMNAFDVENLNLVLETKRSEPLFAKMRFDIEEVDVSYECAKCGHKAVDARFDDHEFAHRYAHAPAMYEPPACAKCGGETKMTSGNEIELVSISS